MRTYFSIGASGFLIRNIQYNLGKKGYAVGSIDGKFGGVTRNILEDYQEENDLSVTGTVTDETWIKLMNSPGPKVWERCLQITSVLEGHGFTKVRGNWDTAGITWGIIGFTLKSGSLQVVLKKTDKWWPKLLKNNIVGSKLMTLDRVLNGSNREAVKWGNNISIEPKKYRIVKEWRDIFIKLGKKRELEMAQALTAYEMYYVKAEKLARRFKLTSELGYGLLFDTCVQMGGVGRKVSRKMKALPANTSDRDRRIALANFLSDFQSPKRFKEVVRSRKMLFARGQGKVYGKLYKASIYGLIGRKLEIL